MKILVCGSRTWSDYAAIERVLSDLVDRRGRFVVMHGAARGADRLAGAAARRLGLEVIEYPADWKRHGRRAGYDPAHETMMAQSDCPPLDGADERQHGHEKAHSVDS